jgi:hypothetical protein
MAKLTDKNRLSIVNPELCKEWDYDKNGDLTPEDISFGSNKRVWWKCREGHEWEATPDDRSNGSGCPLCRRIFLRDGTSFSSIGEAYYYLKHIKPKYKRIHFDDLYGFGKHRYDFYLPQINTYIEVTSFCERDGGWAKDNLEIYLDAIDKKREFVEEVLGAKFKFIQLKLTKKQKIFVRKNSV